MPSDLKPHIKEDREAERLINKDVAPSRKRREKRGPKHDNRRRRMKTDDPDLKKTDRDMSLNYKYSFLDIALDILVSKMKYPDEFNSVYSQIYEVSPLLAHKYEEYMDYNYFLFDSSDAYLKNILSEQNTNFNNLSKENFFGLSPYAQSRKIYELWPKNEGSFEKRAAILLALSNSIDKTDVPSSLKHIYKTDPSKASLNSIKNVLKDSISLNSKDLENSVEFASLVGIYNYLLQDPKSISLSELKKIVADSINIIPEQIESIGSFGPFQDEWERMNSEFDNPDIDFEDKIKSVQDRIDKFFYSKKKGPPFDRTSFYEALSESVDPGKLNKSEMKKLFKLSAASNEMFFTANMNKVSAYHGVKIQHHPEEDSFGQNTILKRNIGKKDIDGIISFAKDLMKEDWYSNDWELGSPDAPYRAALDVSISTLDNSNYQSKIDSNLYNLMLAKLMGFDSKELFSETFISGQKPGGRLATMNNHKMGLVRIANDIRKSDPNSYLVLLRVASNLKISKDINFKEIKNQVELLKKAKNSDDVLESIGKLAEMTKMASSRIASVVDSLEFIEDMSDEELKKFLDMSKRDITTLDQVLDKIEKESKGDLSKMSDEDIEFLIGGIDDLMGGIEDKAKKVKTSSMLVDIPTLVKLASSSPEAKKILLPVLAAAKRKMTKKKPSKTSTPEKEEKKDKKKPESDPKAKKPEAKKPEAKKPAKSRKASSDLTDQDLDW